MKRFTMILALALMVTMPLMAERVTPETARKVAAAFLNNNGSRSDQLTDLTKATGFPNLYIFTTENSFVVMSADDCVKPILGYSMTNGFSATEMPENLMEWLKSYNNQIQFAIEHKTKASSNVTKQWKELTDGKNHVAKTAAVVNALIQTEWDQGTPYNNLCPSGTVTGCVATAMAQIMYFHKHPTTGIGMHSYIHSDYGELSANFSQETYDWDNMKTKYTSYTQTEADAVATLMYHCGVSVNMNYGPSSGAFSPAISDALINYFGYSTSARFVERDDYETEDWIALLKKELDEGRPMEYSGSGSGGHSFICDGYNSDGKFHFNWGWNGTSNGWFDIDGLTPPTNHNYNEGQGATIGIKIASCSIGAASNFTAQLIVGSKNALLKWDSQSEAVGYCIFRNGTLIDSIAPNRSETITYIDERIPYGTNVYYIRSVDSNNEMSLPSEYKSITIQLTAPTSLSATYADGKVDLSWLPATGCVAYAIYRNDVQVATNISTVSYEETPIPGSLTYYVKGLDEWGDESPASNSVTVSVPYTSPVVHDLSTSALTAQNATLTWSAPEWCYPTSQSGLLTYGNDKSYYYLNCTYYGHRFPAENLTQYANKAIYKVSTRIEIAGTYTIYVYTNTINNQPDPDSLKDVRIIKCTNANGWTDIPLSEPILLSGTTDLWIVIKQEGTNDMAPIPTFNLSSYNANACYCGDSSPTDIEPFSDNYRLCWYIRAYLTDMTYTYNLYDGNTKMNTSAITGTSYSIEDISNDAIHQYSVKTIYNGNETSTASNMAGITMGTASVSTLNLDTNDKMTIAEGSKLTVSGALNNEVAANLVLENGAQLINDSENVAATVKKTIQPYTNGKHDGWNLIASPITGSIEPSADNGLLAHDYDLYLFDQTQAAEWRNYEANPKPFTTIDHKVGYLYANNNVTTLTFAGTLAGNAEPTELTLAAETEFAGFNLIGNPYPCNAYINRPFYVVDYDAENDNAKFVLGENPIAPCAAILVQATTEGESIDFSKAALSKGAKIAVKLSQAKQRNISPIDQVRITFQQGNQIVKYPQKSSTSTICIPQDGKEFAVAYADGQTEKPINFKAAHNGTYTLNIEIDNLELEYLHLIDNLTGNDVDLLTTPSYTFEAQTTDYASRFRLVFDTKTTDSVSTDSATFAYVNNGEIVITNAADAYNASLQIMDVTGRIIITHSGRIQCIPTTGMVSGVYVLRLITADGVKTQKIVVE